MAYGLKAYSCHPLMTIFQLFYKKKMNAYKQKSITANKHVYKWNHSDDNVARFKNSLPSVNWSEILDGVNANSDYDNFIKKFTEI